MRCLKLTVAYDGTNFCGWQWQPHVRTVQGVLESAVRKTTGEVLRIVASGRTDSGVHAIEQVASLTTQSGLPPEVMLRALNAYLPPDVAVRDVREVREGFNAIDDAVAKRYRYLIHDGPVRSVLTRHYAWHVRQRLDVPAMHEAAQTLCGTHDFKSYESAGSARVSTIRTIHEIRIARLTDESVDTVAVEVEANGFLYNMVRNIVGTVVEVGRGKRPRDWPTEVLEARDRRRAGMTAPPHGLYLLRVRLREAPDPGKPNGSARFSGSSGDWEGGLLLGRE